EFKEGNFKYQTDSNGDDEGTVKDYIVNTVPNDEIDVTVESADESTYKYKELDLEGKVTTSGNNDNVITLNYGEDMSDSARDVNNYKLDEKEMPAGTTVDFVGDKDKVEISLPKGTIDSTTKYKLSVSTDVTNAKGSHMVDSLQTKQAANTVIQLTDSVAPELASAKYIVDTDSVEADTESSTIEVTFNEAISFEQ